MSSITRYDFFGADSLESKTYYYYLPDLDWKSKSELSTAIQANQGVKKLNQILNKFLVDHILLI